MHINLERGSFITHFKAKVKGESGCGVTLFKTKVKSGRWGLEREGVQAKSKRERRRRRLCSCTIGFVEDLMAEIKAFKCPSPFILALHR